MIYYMCPTDMVCGSKRTLYTAAELRRYQLDKTKFKRVRLTEQETEVRYGVRTERGDQL